MKDEYDLGTRLMLIGELYNPFREDTSMQGFDPRDIVQEMARSKFEHVYRTNVVPGISFVGKNAIKTPYSKEAQQAAFLIQKGYLLTICAYADAGQRATQQHAGHQ